MSAKSSRPEPTKLGKSNPELRKLRNRIGITGIICARSVYDARRLAVDPQNKLKLDEKELLAGCEKLQLEELKLGTLGNLLGTRVNVVDYPCSIFEYGVQGTEKIEKNANYTGQIKVDYGQQPQVATHTPSLTHSVELTIGDGLGCYTSSTSSLSNAPTYPGYLVDGLWQDGQPTLATLRYNDGSSYYGTFLLGYEFSFCSPPPSMLASDYISSRLDFIKSFYPDEFKDPTKIISQFTFTNGNHSRFAQSTSTELSELQFTELSSSSPIFYCNSLNVRWIQPVKNWGIYAGQIVPCTGSLKLASNLLSPHKCSLPFPIAVNGNCSDSNVSCSTSSSYLPTELQDLITEYHEHFILEFSLTLGDPPILSLVQGPTSSISSTVSASLSRFAKKLFHK